MTLSLPGSATVRLVGIVLLAAAAFALAFVIVTRLWPRHDPVPAQLARKDEKAAQASAAAIGTSVARQNDDATLHIDLTTKDIADAFRTIPAPAPQPTGAAQPRALPAAPVDRLRDRLNESIARANRAAGPADPTD